MKNRDFFFLQYNKINWKNQEKTKINADIYAYIIDHVIAKKRGDSLAVFDIGFGIGFFMRMMLKRLKNRYERLTIGGCEPSAVNFSHLKRTASLSGEKNTFQKLRPRRKYDFITAIYVFPHFLSADMDKIAKKISSMLNDGGQFIMVMANEDYLKKKLASEKDLFIEKTQISYRGKKYRETLYYSDIPKIGKVIDYNRDDSYYVDMLRENKLRLVTKKELNDHGFICSLFVFEKK